MNGSLQQLVFGEARRRSAMAGCRATGRSRRGMTLIEMAAALVILSAAMVALVQFVGLAARQRRASYQRQAALMEVANQAERLALLGWDEVAPDKLTKWEPSDVLAAAVPQSERRIIVTEQSELPVSRRIRLRVSWTGAAGQQVEPVELTIWKFRMEAQP
jgi:prepilin-type N-terminal cleavage/methylation domain-containing protein